MYGTALECSKWCVFLAAAAAGAMDLKYRPAGSVAMAKSSSVPPQPPLLLLTGDHLLICQARPWQHFESVRLPQDDTYILAELNWTHSLDGLFSR